MSKRAQTLAVVSRLFPLILNGEKTSTIRWCEDRLAAGMLTFFNLDDPAQRVDVEVTRCTDMPLSAAARFVGHEDEWPDPVMLAGMREHYPTIELSSIVQVIEFITPDSELSTD